MTKKNDLFKDFYLNPEGNPNLMIVVEYGPFRGYQTLIFHQYLEERMQYYDDNYDDNLHRYSDHEDWVVKWLFV